MFANLIRSLVCSVGRTVGRPVGGVCVWSIRPVPGPVRGSVWPLWVHRAAVGKFVGPSRAVALRDGALRAVRKVGLVVHNSVNAAELR